MAAAEEQPAADGSGDSVRDLPGLGISDGTPAAGDDAAAAADSTTSPTPTPMFPAAAATEGGEVEAEEEEETVGLEVSSSDVVIQKGAMFKQGGLNTAWQKRYFIATKRVRCSFLNGILHPRVPSRIHAFCSA
jgi:hypothetical protein